MNTEDRRLYWKDADCPDQWKEWLRRVIPHEVMAHGPGDLLRHLHEKVGSIIGHGIAYLRVARFIQEKVESLMCYLGIGDTYTAAHTDLCASTGHNIMCFSENDGSSFWFMADRDSAHRVAEYFQKELNREVDWEDHVTTVEELSDAPFTVYVEEQKVGDLVLVPPRCVHQVVNRGGLAMKASWSRMPLDNLRQALRYELPVYRRYTVHYSISGQD